MTKKLLSDKSQKRLKELRDSHKWCCIRINSDYNYCWDVLLISANRDENPEHTTTLKVNGYDDLNDAIEDIYKKMKESDGQY